MVSTARTKREKPKWIYKDIWTIMVAYWDTEEAQQRSASTRKHGFSDEEEEEEEEGDRSLRRSDPLSQLDPHLPVCRVEDLEAFRRINRKRKYAGSSSSFTTLQSQLEDANPKVEEQAAREAEALQVTLSQAAEIKHLTMMKKNIDDIDKTMDEINEQIENMKQLQKALSAPERPRSGLPKSGETCPSSFSFSRTKSHPTILLRIAGVTAPIGSAADFDEDELEAELEELECAELEEQLLQPVPIHVPQGNKPNVVTLGRLLSISLAYPDILLLQTYTVTTWLETIKERIVPSHGQDSVLFKRPPSSHCSSSHERLLERMSDSASRITASSYGGIEETSFSEMLKKSNSMKKVAAESSDATEGSKGGGMADVDVLGIYHVQRTNHRVEIQFECRCGATIKVLVFRTGPTFTHTTLPESPHPVVTVFWDGDSVTVSVQHCQGSVWLRLSTNVPKTPVAPPPTTITKEPAPAKLLLEAPPGFPPLFPELSKEDRKMALQYISHVDETERLARILRVKQSIEESAADSSTRLIKITSEVDKGKGHVFDYKQAANNFKRPCLKGTKPIASSPALVVASDGESFSNSSIALSQPFQSGQVSTGFSMGLNFKASSSGNLKAGKKERRRPPSWKRKLRASSSQVVTDSKSSKGPTLQDGKYGGFRFEAAAIPMSILSWNCQGAGSSETVQYIRGLRRQHFSDFMFLMETKQKLGYMSELKNSLGYDNLVTVEPLGLSGGLALMWKNSYKVEVLSKDKRIIDTKISLGSIVFCVTFVYGDPVRANRQVVWDRLSGLGLIRDAAWLLVGDFNELLTNAEKKGGPPRDESSFWGFREMAENCKITELRSSGNSFSWGGLRNSIWVQCRLDRSFGNDEWFNLFPRANTKYLSMWASDHRPIRMGWSTAEGPDTTLLDRIQRCRKSMARWKKQADLNSRDRINRLQTSHEAEISKLHPNYNLLKQIKGELARALQEEELFWRQKCREEWLKSGDLNTKFFHNSVKGRKLQNRILMLLDDSGNEHFSEGSKGQVAVDYFRDLFMSSNPHDLETIFQGFQARVTSDMNARLIAPISDEEIKRAAFSVKSSNVSGRTDRATVISENFGILVQDSRVDPADGPWVWIGFLDARRSVVESGYQERLQSVRRADGIWEMLDESLVADTMEFDRNGDNGSASHRSGTQRSAGKLSAVMMAGWRSSGSADVLRNKLSELFREFTKGERCDANEEFSWKSDYGKDSPRSALVEGLDGDLAILKNVKDYGEDFTRVILTEIYRWGSYIVGESEKEIRGSIRKRNCRNMKWGRLHVETSLARCIDGHLTLSEFPGWF
ncbi:Endonuclease/exonuclease/phosphatase, partial [Arabidopsis suecica]